MIHGRVCIVDECFRMIINIKVIYISVCSRYVPVCSQWFFTLYGSFRMLFPDDHCSLYMVLVPFPMPLSLYLWYAYINVCYMDLTVWVHNPYQWSQNFSVCSQFFPYALLIFPYALNLSICSFGMSHDAFCVVCVSCGILSLHPCIFSRQFMDLYVRY